MGAFPSSLLLYKRGNGQIFYFRPGHEAYPTYHNKDIQRIIINAKQIIQILQLLSVLQIAEILLNTPSGSVWSFRPVGEHRNGNANII